MSRTRTLTQLIADVRQRANMESSTFISDAEITEYVNQELAELWTRLGQAGGHPPYRSTSNISVATPTALYALPADFWQLQGVEGTIDGVTQAIMSFMPLERAALRNQMPWTVKSPIQYRLQGNNIEFLPALYTFTATIYYTPSCPRLVNGADTFDGFNGFEVAAIYGTVATCQAKEETDPSFYAGQKDRIYRHIDSISGLRDASMPERVQDVVGYDGDSDFGGWFPWP